MTLHFGRKFWRFLTTVVVLFMLFVVGRNLVHAVKIKGQIGTLRRQAEEYREKIAQDSTLVERLRYDDYLEEYARERYGMQRRDERVLSWMIERPAGSGAGLREACAHRAAPGSDRGGAGQYRTGLGW